MITEQMVEEAESGKSVYFVTPEGTCMILWYRSGRLQISLARREDCQQQ